MASKDNNPPPDPAFVEIARHLGRKLTSEDHAPVPGLDVLIGGISDENRHTEIQAGPAVGTELPKP